MDANHYGWVEWIQDAQEVYSSQHVPSEVVDDLFKKAKTIKEAPGSSYRWINTQQMGSLSRSEQNGNILDYIISSGNFGFYKLIDTTADDRMKLNKAGELAIEFGAWLIEKGVEVKENQVELAIMSGSHNLDLAQRLIICERLGMHKAMRKNKALSVCLYEGGWSESECEFGYDWLLRHGAAEGIENLKGGEKLDNPAVAALMGRNWKGFEYVARDGCALDWKDDRSGVTLWHFAALCGVQRAKLVIPWLEKSAAHLVNEVVRLDDDFGEKAWSVKGGDTPLLTACKDLEEYALIKLLDFGAGADVLDKQGQSPLHLIARRYSQKAQDKSYKIIERLLQAGAKAEVKNKDGKTAAQVMSKKGPLGALEKLLEARPQDVGGESEKAREAFDNLARREEREFLALAQRAALEVKVNVSGDGRKARKGNRI